MALNRRIVALMIIAGAGCVLAPVKGQDSLRVDSTFARDLTGGTRESFDIDLAVTRLSSLLESPDSVGTNMPEAVYLYVNLLYNADLVNERANETLVTTLLQAFSIVAPESIASSLIDGGGRRRAHVPIGSAPRIRDGAGPRLVAWWRRNDPRPATESNELVEEHLIRLAHVLNTYSNQKWPGGFDARGEIWLRYGEPSKKIVIDFNDTVLTDIIYRPGVTVAPTDFPDNEFWMYRHIDRAAYFLFFDDGNGFKLGDSQDLIPRSLRTGFSSQTRGRIKAGMTIAVLQNIYRQLSLLHPDFAVRYAEVDQYAMRLPEFTTGRMAARLGRPLSTAPENISDGSNGVEAPDVFAQGMLVRTQTEDDVADARREEVVPITVTESDLLRPQFQVAYRVIRKLTSNGQTVVDIYWAPQPGRLGVDDAIRSVVDIGNPERFMLAFTSVAKGEMFTTMLVQTDHILVVSPEPVPGGEDDSKFGILVPTQTMRIAPAEQIVGTQAEQTDSSRVGIAGAAPMGSELHLALQWDQYALTEPGRDASVGPLLRTRTAFVDSLEILETDESRLEISDILPLISLVDEDPLLENAEPYPFRILAENQQLALSFEVYHLSFNVDDRTRYQIRFIVKRGRKENGLFKLSRKRESETSVSFVRSGESRTASEMIQVDLGDTSGRGQLEITVKVTDETTGQTVSRKLEFELQR
jgi:GWxTD domain-containing protein